MSTFQGSISNYPLMKRAIFVILSTVLPAAVLTTTVVLFFMVDWWAYALIVDLMVITIAFSLSGILLKGHTISFFEDELSFIKGWSKGRIPYRNIIKVYRVFNNSRDAVLIVFNEPASRNNPNRCLAVEQTFNGNDRKRIFKRLNKDHDRFSFSIVDDATLDLITNEKRSLKWVPV